LWFECAGYASTGQVMFTDGEIWWYSKKEKKTTFKGALNNFGVID